MGEVEATQCLNALERIRASRTFSNSEKLVQFLEFVVQSSVRGEAEGLKETVIGMGLFKRGADYDPKQDSIVRTQASRLRERLEEYYLTEGAHDPVRIQLIKGSYAPIFTWRESPPPAGVPVEGVRPEASSPAMDTVSKRGRTWRSHAALFLLLVTGVALLFTFQPGSLPEVVGYSRLTTDGRPKWLIGTDGVRIYQGTGNFATPGLAQVSVEGGDSVAVPVSRGGLKPLGLSASGERILLSEYYPGQLWSLDLIGGALQPLNKAVGPEAAWSPDGQQLAYCRGMDIWLASADGAHPRKIATIPSRRIYGLEWSPDGKRLRFAVWESSVAPALWELPLDGKKPYPLLPGWRTPPDEENGRWSADGRYFVFQSGGQIWALPGRRSLAGLERPVRLTNSPMRLSHPLPSRDGDRIFVVGKTERGVLVRHDASLNQWLPFLAGISAEQVAFSRDGEWIAYVTYPDGVLWRCRRDGTQRIRLSSPPLYLARPEWSPDGKRILCFGNAEKVPVPRAYIFPVEGGPPEVINSGALDRFSSPSWFPDGKRITVVNDPYPRPYQVEVIDLPTNRRTVIPGSQDMYSGVVSPDGTHLVAIRRNPISLMLYDFGSKKWSELARVTGGFPNWSRDGRYVYFLRFPDGPAVLRIRVSDRSIETVADLDGIQLTGNQGCWLGLTADDSPLVLQDYGTQDIYALELKKK